MKIKVEVFRDEEDRKSNLSSWHTFNLSIDVPYPFPAAGDEFKKVLTKETHIEILKKLCAEGCSQKSVNLSADDVARDSIPANIACAAKDWDCKEKSFTAQLKFSRRHAVQTYNNDDSMTLTDYSKPDEIFYLKGVIDQ